MAAAGVAFVRPSTAVSFAPRSVSLYNTHTGEWVRTVYWADGHYIREAVRDINWVLRDHHSDEVRPMNAGVLDVLGMLRSRLDSREPFLVISGYRSPATNEWLRKESSGVAEHSLHMKGQAIDLCAPGRSLKKVHEAALNLRLGGVGYYPDSDFIHVDTGRVRRWTG